MTTATANPSFPDIHTKQDLPVDSYLRLTKSDVAKVYQHVHADRGLSKLVIEFENIRDTFHDKLDNFDGCYFLNLWGACRTDYHYNEEDKGTPLPKHGDYRYFVIVHCCHDMAPVALEIAKLITGYDDWQIVTNNHHSAVYSPSRRMLYDILADAHGENAYHFPEATCLDDGEQVSAFS